MQILIKPIITEKSLAKTSSGCYVFKVAKNANKAQIASAIFDLYQVKPVKVNIIRLKAEKKLVRSRFAVAVKSWKKAIVTLKKGQKIPGFEEKWSKFWNQQTMDKEKCQWPIIRS